MTILYIIFFLVIGFALLSAYGLFSINGVKKQITESTDIKELTEILLEWSHSEDIIEFCLTKISGLENDSIDSAIKILTSKEITNEKDIESRKKIIYRLKKIKHEEYINRKKLLVKKLKIGNRSMQRETALALIQYGGHIHPEKDRELIDILLKSLSEKGPVHSFAIESIETLSDKTFNIDLVIKKLKIIGEGFRYRNLSAPLVSREDIYHSKKERWELYGLCACCNLKIKLNTAKHEIDSWDGQNKEKITCPICDKVLEGADDIILDFSWGIYGFNIEGKS